MKTIYTFVIGLLLATSSVGFVSARRGEQLNVHKNRTCGCCAKWVSILWRHSFKLHVLDVDNLEAIKDRYKIPKNLRSCHTTVAANYVFEGHIPPDLVSKVLTERPDIVGLAVPGMPIGSPGMETADGRRVPYSVIAFTRDGKQTVFARR